MTTILVTGGAGFIGSNLCIKLLAKGYTVIAIDNLITSTGKNVAEISHNKNFHFIKHDITKKLPKSLYVKKIDTIFHLACPTGVPNLIPLAEEMIQTCSIGTKNVCELARINHAKLLFSSSSEAYGDPEVFPQKENYTGNVNPDGVRSPYEEGKRFAETIVMMYVRKYGLDARIVRIFNTYGPRMSLHDSRVIPKFLSSVLYGLPLPIQGNGLQKRTFCYIDDLIDGLSLILSKSGKGEVYNIGSDTEITIQSLAKKIIKTTKTKSVISYVDRPTHDHKRRLPSLKKIKELGWKPSVSLDEGLKKTIQWYKKLSFNL